MEASEITLPAAARELGQSWAQTWRQVLTGELEGRQGAGGKWLVKAASVERAKEAREQQLASA